MATFAIARPKRETGPWNIAVWAGQASLAALLVANGIMRTFLPLHYMQERLPWVDATNDWWLRTTGFALLCAAAALLLPPVLKLSLRLVPATAIFMAMVMVVTAASHIIRGRPVRLAGDLAVIALCVFVTWGRTRKVPY
jgi:putative oxidoreductase